MKKKLDRRCTGIGIRGSQSGRDRFSPRIEGAINHLSRLKVFEFLFAQTPLLCRA